MTFKVGDRVLVRLDIASTQSCYMEDSAEFASFVPAMSQYNGKVFTVISTTDRGYHLEGIGDYLWTDEMLAFHPIEFEIGTRVKYVNSFKPELKEKVGTVIGYRWNGVNLVEFDSPIPNGHVGTGPITANGRKGCCWYCLSYELEAVNNETGR